MENKTIIYLGLLLIGSLLSSWSTQKWRFGFAINLGFICCVGFAIYMFAGKYVFFDRSFYVLLPIAVVSLIAFALRGAFSSGKPAAEKYRARFPVRNGTLKLDNIKRGVSIIGSAGSGKTESVVYHFLKHFAKHQFLGVIHDYKHFELAEIAQPIFAKQGIPFYIVSFNPIYNRVNPIAPKYLPDEESVFEISRVLVENLLELRESGSQGTSKFFNDAAQGLVCGLIWRLRTDYPKCCTVPHLIALYQRLSTEQLIDFLSRDRTSRAMADAFVNGKDSDRQMAGVKSTLGNAFLKIGTKKIFMALSKDDTPLDINNDLKKSGVICVVNDPFYETTLSPVIAMIVHAITKQMSVRNRPSSFLMLEEAPTLRLLNMHRVPATLRSYDIVTVYVMQDKIQNDIMYGDKMGKAILSNLSYQFFGKVNDPDTAQYYERFFEIVKKKTRSYHKSGGLDFDSRVTIGEKEVAKTRADAFYGLKQGEFVVFADGKDRRVRFKEPIIEKSLTAPPKNFSDKKMKKNFARIHREVQQLFEKEAAKRKKPKDDV